MKLNYTIFVIILSFTYLGWSSTQGGKANIRVMLTSCLDLASHPVIPCLSYEKNELTIPYNGTCTSFDTSLRNASYSWFSYPTLPNGACNIQNCNRTITKSFVVLGQRTWANVNGQSVGTSYGEVMSGPYLGYPVTHALTLVGSNVLQCNSQMGMEAQSGVLEVTIGNVTHPGPTCNGVYSYEFCPGITN